MRPSAGIGVIAVDMFYTVFAVMFILEATTENFVRQAARSYETRLELPWASAWGEQPSRCLALVDVVDSSGAIRSNLENGYPDPEIRDGKCILRFGEPVDLVGNAGALDVHFMLLRYPAAQANDVTLRVGPRTIDGLSISSDYSECGPGCQ